MASVSLRHVYKRYPNGFEAVKDFNLEIADKEFIILVGPSGCGKSTTMRMVAGLEDISEGEVEIDGTLVNDLPPKERDVAMVFQDYALYPHLSVRENMSLSLRLKKVERSAIDKRVKEAAEILNIDHLLDTLPREMSGGQRQRVALGRAIVRTPKVFMFDEPLSNLDPKLRNTMRVELKRLHRRLATTMIYVTHDQVEAMTLGDRIIVMNDGIIQQVGDPIAVYNEPANQFVASFIGSPPMNFFEGEMKEDGDKLYLMGPTLKLVVPRQNKLHQKLQSQFKGKPKLTIGIRAEDMKVAGTGVGSDSTIQATVEVLEPIAPEVYLHLNTENNDFIVRDINVMASKVTIGESVDIAIDLNRIHIFDADGGAVR